MNGTRWDDSRNTFILIKKHLDFIEDVLLSIKDNLTDGTFQDMNKVVVLVINFVKTFNRGLVQIFGFLF